jgi:hypothetical protein
LCIPSFGKYATPTAVSTPFIRVRTHRRSNPSCAGFFTRIVNDQKSAIDYILLSKIMCKNVDSVFIDESGKYDLHSDHVILSIQINDVPKVFTFIFRGYAIICKKKSSYYGTLYV